MRLCRYFENDTCTLGCLYCGDLVLNTLELPWRKNAVNISRIPPGIYDCGLAHHGRIAVKDVPGREGIQIHIGNKPSETHGCILVGNTVGENWVGGSAAAMSLLLQRLNPHKLEEEGFSLEIKDCFPLNDPTIPSSSTKLCAAPWAWIKRFASRLRGQPTVGHSAAIGESLARLASSPIR